MQQSVLWLQQQRLERGKKALEVMDAGEFHSCYYKTVNTFYPKSNAKWISRTWSKGQTPGPPCSQGSALINGLHCLISGPMNLVFQHSCTLKKQRRVTHPSSALNLTFRTPFLRSKRCGRDPSQAFGDRKEEMGLIVAMPIFDVRSVQLVAHDLDAAP